ncbi:predicted protein [Uncinocarpus reesii 1704]|uniref:Uncharacterized protein n=1 Tax=Uncinocarpus reesii (strain UAMH 1704) TaxID=336963 RepID=C4JLJ6_UNCRE|nr:uncharacterized protein UREG_03704 [Uncinocarpus reesii 1704]EEP78858.1 predicted protein [Uncinocarpus reesii 1704]
MQSIPTDDVWELVEAGVDGKLRRFLKRPSVAVGGLLIILGHYWTSIGHISGHFLKLAPEKGIKARHG